MASERESDSKHSKYVPISKAEMKALREDVAQDIPDDVCCCGDSMENHDSPMNCGHSAVSMRAHYLSSNPDYYCPPDCKGCGMCEADGPWADGWAERSGDKK